MIFILKNKQVIQIAIDKPWRDIEFRPNAIKKNPHHYCLHSLADKTKLTKAPNHYLLDVYCYVPELGLEKIKEKTRLQRLILRRKLRQRYIASMS